MEYRVGDCGIRADIAQFSDPLNPSRVHLVVFLRQQHDFHVCHVRVHRRGPGDYVAFHDSDWQQRFELSRKLKDPRLQKILLFTEAPNCLPAEIRFAYDREFSQRLVAAQAEWLTLPKAIEDTDDILKTAKHDLKPFLTEYRAYLDRRFKHEMAKVV